MSDHQNLKRVCIPSLESILGQPLSVLDHGFIRVVDYMGGDESIVQAARVSYGKGTKQTSEDRGLIRYLMRHSHTTPFEMCEIKLHIKLPMFIARQWIRHRTANVNEYSARYSVLDQDFYIPNLENLGAQSQTNHQGTGQKLDTKYALEVQKKMRQHCENAYALYTQLLQSDDHTPGLSRELARTILPINIYTQWYWKIDLHNLLHFVALRIDSHAQHEIQAYAKVLLHILELWVPLTCQAFKDYRLNGCKLSAHEINALKKMVQQDDYSKEQNNMSPREWREFLTIFATPTS